MDIRNRLLLLGRKKKMPPNCVQLTGATSWMTCGSDTGLDDLHAAAFTVEMWVYAINTKASRLHNKGSSSGHTSRTDTGGKITATVYCATTNATTVLSSGLFTPGAWHHVAICYDNAGDRKPTIWLDGAKPAQTQVAGDGAIVSDATPHALYFGNSGSEWVDGYYGWTRVSNIVRYTSAFVPDARLTPPVVDANTIAQWNMTEGTGTNVDNAEGTAARDGTLSNCVWVYRP